MHPAELISPDLLRMTFVLGMVLSVFLYEKSHLTTGSIVVPGFLAIHIFEPLTVIMLLLNSWICFGLVHKLLPRFLLMGNKAKFHSLLIASVFLQLTWNALSTIQSPMAPVTAAFSGLGYVIPGLIAHDMSRNGPLKTSLNVLMVSYAVGAIMFLTLISFPDACLNLQGFTPLPISFDLVVVLTLSTLGAVLLKLRTPIRSAGYVTAAYIVFFSNSLITLTTIAIAALVTYFVCCSWLIPSMIIFGRRKFAIVLITGALTMWGSLLMIKSLGIQMAVANHPLYAGILILIPGLIANDMQRTSMTQVATGLGLLVSWIFVATSLYYEFRSFSRPEQILPLLGSLSGILLVTTLLKKPSMTRFPHADIPVQHGAST